MKNPRLTGIFCYDKNMNLEYIATEYGLGKVLRTERILEGVLNDNYLLETEKGKYFIKGIRGKVTNRIPYIHKVEIFMKENGIPAVSMLATEKGDISLIQDGVNFCCYPFIESDRSHIYSAEDYYRCGHMLGRIHRLSNHVPEELKQYRTKNRSREEILKELHKYKKEITAIEKKTEIDELFLAYIDMKLRLSETWVSTVLPPDNTLKHGDFHAGNLLIEKVSREIIGICDWEKAEYGIRSYELARSVLYIAFDKGTDYSGSYKIAARILEGYRSVIDISEEEFVNGFNVRLENHVLCFWIENSYYVEKNTRTIQFIENEMNILREFVENDGIEKLRHLFK
jgi:Ser/Thr protein kinase RdoA (MazF antagonist)